MEPPKSFKFYRVYSLNSYQMTNYWKVKKQHCYQLNINSQAVKMLKNQSYSVLAKSKAILYSVKSELDLINLSSRFRLAQKYSLKIQQVDEIVNQKKIFYRYIVRELKSLPKSLTSFSLASKKYCGIFKDKYFRRIVKQLYSKRKLSLIHFNIFPKTYGTFRTSYPQFQHIKYAINKFKKYLHHLTEINLMNHFLDTQIQLLPYKYGQALAQIPSLTFIPLQNSKIMLSKGYYKNLKEFLQGLCSGSDRIRIPLTFGQGVSLPRKNFQLLKQITQLKFAKKDLFFNLSHSFFQFPLLFDLIKTLTSEDNLSIHFQGIPHKTIHSKAEDFKDQLKQALISLQENGLYKLSITFSKRCYKSLLIDPAIIAEYIEKIPCKQVDIILEYLSHKIRDDKGHFWRLLNLQKSQEIKLIMCSNQLSFKQIDEYVNINTKLQVLSIKHSFLNQNANPESAHFFLKQINQLFPSLQILFCELCKDIQVWEIEDKPFNFDADWDFLTDLKYFSLEFTFLFIEDVSKFSGFLYDIREKWHCKEFQLQFRQSEESNNIKSNLPSFIEYSSDKNNHILKTKNFYDDFGNWQEEY